MEREQEARQRSPAMGGDPLPGRDLDQVRDKLDRILDVADKVLASVPPVQAEKYLQQSRQRGAE